MAEKQSNRNQNYVTLEDIARMADVSVSTVSRVINGGSVSEKTRKRVERILRENQYFPNAIARSLRGCATNSIGVIIPDITNPFFTRIINELGKSFEDLGYSIIICNTFDNEAIERKQIESLLQRRVDGLIVTSANTDFAKVYEHINKTQPVVLVDRVISPRLDSVRTDNVEGAMLAVSFLLNIGYRKILTIAGPQQVTPGQERLEGYKKALELYNIPLREDLIRYGNFSKRSGYDVVEKVMREKIPVDAIFAANNFLGVGAIEALRANNLRVPDDVALIMFDDMDLADVVDPPLTVVDQLTEEIGREVGNLIRERIHDGGYTKPREILIKSKLIIRGSA